MSVPTPAAPLLRRPRWSWRRRLVVAGLAVGVTAGGCLTAVAADRPDPAARYVTGRVERGSVTQSTDFLGTVGVATPVSASFPVAGTVASVAVSPGARVVAGQVLATLDPTAADASLAQARASLATAQANVAAIAQAVTPTATAAPASPTAGAGSAARSAVQAAQQVCAPLLAATGTSGATATSVATGRSARGRGPAQSVSPTATPTATATATATATSTPSATATPTGTPTAASPAPGAVAACLQALQSSLQAEQHAATSTASARAGSTGTAGTGGGGRGASTPEQAEAAVTVAQAQVTVAERAVAGTTLVAASAGEVASVPFTVGATENPSQSVLLVDPGAVSVTVQVPLTEVAGVAVGADAQVTPTGSSTADTGQVTHVALLPTTSGTNSSNSSSSAADGGAPVATDSVTVLVSSPPPTLAIGSSAGVTVTTGRATGVLTVPDSALTPLGGNRADLTVLGAGGSTHVVGVTTGTVGVGRTEVLSGVSLGQQVVLADLSQPLPDAVPTTGGRGLGSTTGAGSGRRNQAAGF